MQKHLLTPPPPPKKKSLKHLVKSCAEYQGLSFDIKLLEKLLKLDAKSP